MKKDGIKEHIKSVIKNGNWEYLYGEAYIENVVEKVGEEKIVDDVISGLAFWRNDLSEVTLDEISQETADVICEEYMHFIWTEPGWLANVMEISETDSLGEEVLNDAACTLSLWVPGELTDNGVKDMIFHSENWGAARDALEEGAMRLQTETNGTGFTTLDDGDMPF